MRIGFDIDGVLVSFTPAYHQLCVDIAGVNRFYPGDDTDPPMWHCPEYRGYSQATVAAVWERIRDSHDFWMSLDEAPGCSTLRLVILDLMRNHDIYFITNRAGRDAKWQTEQWLRLHLGIDLPTVLLSAEKGMCARALKLDCYIDDNAGNVNAVMEQGLGLTRAYLLDRRYNRGDYILDSRVTRVQSVGEFLDRELANL